MRFDYPLRLTRLILLDEARARRQGKVWGFWPGSRVDAQGSVR